MSGSFEDLESPVQEHLRSILTTSGLPEGEESLNELARGWLEKREAFDRQVETLGMISADDLEQSEARAFLVMTYSGSLLGVGPEESGKRQVMYASVGARKDVPDKAVSEESRLDGPVRLGEEVRLTGGPIKKSSAAYRLAVMPPRLSVEDQREKIEEATQLLTEEFVDVNRTVVLEE